ncbi:hypothetical protein LBMAG47_08880 [Planctomycetia bacterium]|nr:hypothetical protein LBMAG47_08880 [Planctomycetia bacterium]
MSYPTFLDALSRTPIDDAMRRRTFLSSAAPTSRSTAGKGSSARRPWRPSRALLLGWCVAWIAPAWVAPAWVAPAWADPPRSPGQSARFFGLEARGRRVVYVCDRSASMGEPDGQPLAAAKRELVRSLDELVDSQQFGIVFYNERTRVFAPNGGVVRPVFAAAESRRQAQAFIADVPAAGGTRHAEAIATALRIGADVVFVLTDGDAEHDLTAGELRSLSRAAGGTRIMVVQFGDGATGRSPRLAELAAETGGTYAVVDPDK